MNEAQDHGLVDEKQFIYLYTVDLFRLFPVLPAVQSVMNIFVHIFW